MKEFYYTYSRKHKLSVVGYVNKKENNFQIGISKCSDKDEYNKKFGREIAKGRSIKNPFSIFSLDNKEQPELLQILFDTRDTIIGKSDKYIETWKKYKLLSKII